MTRRVAILGLGARGARWAEAFHSSGWVVSGFDPEPSAGRALTDLTDMRRETTISATVRNGNWVMCCLPERLELTQMVLQRAQAEAPETSVIAVASRQSDLEDIQSCSIRPSQIVRVTEASDGSLSLDVSERNQTEFRDEARIVLAELAAVLSLSPPKVVGEQKSDAKSA